VQKFDCSHSPAEISARRHQTIEAIIDCLHSIVEEYNTPDTSKCKCTPKQDACDGLALGFLILTFKRLKIYPEASQIVSQAIQEFKTLLDGITFPSHVVISCGGSSEYQCPCGQRYFYGSHCSSCGRYVYSSVPNNTNHTDTCSPLLGYQVKIQDLLNSIEGLSYTDFVRVNTPVKEISTTHSLRANLWDCLEYN